MNSSDSDSSSSSAAASPSPPTTPHQQASGTSLHSSEPDLERLVTHFVAAKKSLSATQHVYRATQLAGCSRALLEEIAALEAKNAFAKRGVDEQLAILREFRDAVAEAGDRAGEEFAQTVERLDVANDRLQATLGSLRGVVITRDLAREHGHGQRAGRLRRGQSMSDEEHDGSDGARDEEEEEEEEQEGNAAGKPQAKTLYDFVDEANHENLLASLRALIDSFNDSRADLDDNLARFDDSITSVLEAIQSDGYDSNPPSKITPYDEPALSIPALFHDMEHHAAEMATLLHSLISHYDLCVSALKHTEGGGAAARAAVQAAELALAQKAQSGVEESLYGAAVLAALDDGERAEMLRVLEVDAAEVEDVVGELRARGSEIESFYGQFSKRAESARRATRGLRRGVEGLRAVRLALPVYLDAVAGFREGWGDLRAAMEGKTQELVGLCGFYEQFGAGYGKLLREVERRAGAEALMAKVADKAGRELERLHQADREAREEFVEDVGGFLPGDIWPGLGDRGSRWEVREVRDEDVAQEDEEEEEGGGRWLREG